MASSAPERVVEEEEDEEEEEEEEERWANHYSSLHEILLVGEGDFSFSLSIANTFGSAANIVATSLDTHDTVVGMYAKAKLNLESLTKMGATILHRVDATMMKLHTDLKMRKFDRIVYNFPHAGFKGKEDEPRLINLHRHLVRGFFYNASHMLRPNGEVHVTHKTEAPYNKWNLEELASKNSLLLRECADFNITDYPGYNNKRGDGVNRDLPFRLGECRTFKFRIGDIHELKKARKKIAAKSLISSFGEAQVDDSRNIGRINHPLAIRFPQTDCIFNMGGRPQQEFVINVEGIRPRYYSPPRIGIRRVSSTDTEGMPRTVYSQPRIGIGSIPQPNFEISADGIRRGFYPSLGTGISSVPSRLFGYHLEDAHDMIRSFGPDFRHADRGFMRNGNEVFRNREPDNSTHAYRGHHEELDAWRNSERRVLLRGMLLREAQETEAARVRGVLLGEAQETEAAYRGQPEELDAWRNSERRVLLRGTLLREAQETEAARVQGVLLREAQEAEAARVWWGATETSSRNRSCSGTG